MLKKRGKASIVDSDKEVDKLLEDLAESVVENIYDGYKTEEDPFAIYSLNLRAHFFMNTPDYKAKVIKGYSTLLEEIESQK